MQELCETTIKITNREGVVDLKLFGSGNCVGLADVIPLPKC